MVLVVEHLDDVLVVRGRRVLNIRELSKNSHTMQRKALEKEQNSMNFFWIRHILI